MQVLPLLVALVALNVQAAAAQNPQEQSELCIFTRTKLESFLSRETGCQTVHVRDTLSLDAAPEPMTASRLLVLTGESK